MSIKISLVALLLVTIISCNEDCIINNVSNTGDFGKPIWPQYGHDARHTGNISAIKTYMKPVELGQEYWTYNFAPEFASDGSEITIDSKGNIYFLNQTSAGKLYKISPQGDVIWKIDSISAYNYFAMALSADEKRIYFAAYLNQDTSGLCCIDSSGNILWVNSDVFPDASRPVTGTNSEIYVHDISKIHSIDANGVTSWSINDNDYNHSEIALDKDNNLYIGGRNIKKIDDQGNIVWIYTPTQTDFLTQGIVIDANNNIYFASHVNRAPYNLYSLTKDGMLRWQKDTNYSFIPAIDKNNIIYCGGKGITSLDTSGNIIWHQPTLGNSFYLSENPVLDDESNIYYLVDGDVRQAGSFDRNGNLRWNYTAVSSTATLPGPALSPLGYLVFGPKRSFRITSVK